MSRSSQKQRSEKDKEGMSKLSNRLKALINAPAARPGTVPASRSIQSVYQKIQQDAQSKNVSQPSWLALSVRQPPHS